MPADDYPLWMMGPPPLYLRRGTDIPVPRVPVPAGYALRALTPDDDAGWLRLMSAAFPRNLPHRRQQSTGRGTEAWLIAGARAVAERPPTPSPRAVEGEQHGI